MYDWTELNWTVPPYDFVKKKKILILEFFFPLKNVI